MSKLVINYTNHRGERRNRRITPIDIWFGTNEWHAVPQWLLLARDEDICEDRHFAMACIHQWSGP
jgi:predicted DNA-binding transcriptional regulator YafY